MYSVFSLIQFIKFFVIHSFEGHHQIIILWFFFHFIHLNQMMKKSCCSFFFFFFHWLLLAKIKLFVHHLLMMSVVYEWFKRIFVFFLYIWQFIPNRLHFLFFFFWPCSCFRSAFDRKTLNQNEINQKKKEKKNQNQNTTIDI